MHGEQNGAIYQEVTLSRSDIAPVSLLAEDRADVLKFRINGKQCEHGSHLHPRHTATDARPGQGLWSSLWVALLPHEDQFLPPGAWESGPKDTFVAPKDTITVWVGKYTIGGTSVWHCHILPHDWLPTPVKATSQHQPVPLPRATRSEGTAPPAWRIGRAAAEGTKLARTTRQLPSGQTVSTSA